MNRLLLVCLIALLCVFAIAACGQKGPLFLPGDPSQIQTEVPSQEETEKDEDEESDENTDP